ncbi:MAG: ribonuclease E/G [Lachnospiraceae bacterium]|nr:ribonuclease E/G [Lachnospiraceae bacterium]
MNTVVVITRTQAETDKSVYPDNLLCSFVMEDEKLMEVHPADTGESLLGNIYIGKVKNILKNINAAFVDIAGGRNCFLPLEKATHPVLTNRNYDGKIVAGDEILVQVEKDAVKTKDPMLTADLSFPGKYCSISIGEEKGIRYSHKLTAQKKEELKAVMKSLVLPKDLSLIVRTRSGELSDEEELLAEAQLLIEKAQQLLRIGKTRTVFSMLSEKLPGYIRPYESGKCELPQKIVTDDLSVYNAFSIWLKENALQMQTDLCYYQDERISLFRLYGLGGKLSECSTKNVWLKSGGYLVIEPTEALTVIDVNTGKYTGKKVSEDTFYMINEEAALEVARQLRLRNLSGIIVVDFINMSKKESKEKLLAFLRKACQRDPLPVCVVDMTPLGLVEITRKKVEKPLSEQFRAAL